MLLIEEGAPDLLTDGFCRHVWRVDRWKRGLVDTFGEMVGVGINTLRVAPRRESDGSLIRVSSASHWGKNRLRV